MRTRPLAERVALMFAAERFVGVTMEAIARSFNANKRSRQKADWYLSCWRAARRAIRMVRAEGRKRK